MSKEQTDKSRYPSRYSQGYVTSAQYILELVCEKQAKWKKKDLPMQFWHLPEWKKIFIMQLRKVHKLLKIYSDKAIIRAINKNNICTLLAPWIEEKIKLEQSIIDSNPIILTPDVADDKPIDIIFKPKDNILKNKLSNLDNID